VAGKFFLPNPPAPQSDPLTRYPPPTSAPLMDKQQAVTFKEGSSEPVKFTNIKYASPRIHQLGPSLTITNDSPKQGGTGGSTTQQSASLPPFRLAQVD